MSVDDIKTLRVAIDLLYENGAVTTGREVLAIVRRMESAARCRSCGGSGARDLQAWERAALDLMSDAPISTSEVMRLAWPRVKRPAACNRLAQMERDELVTSSENPSDWREKMWRKAARRG
jgi:hypothetical protein